MKKLIKQNHCDKSNIVSTICAVRTGLPLRTHFTALIVMTIIAMLVADAAQAADRDPFLPYTWSAPTGGNETTPGGGKIPSTNPLIDKPISSYKVIGVVISPTDAMAVMKARDKHEYFAYIGDPIGSEGGIIETINTEGITIGVGGKIVPLKVSNRFENQDEKTEQK